MCSVSLFCSGSFVRSLSLTQTLWPVSGLRDEWITECVVIQVEELDNNVPRFFVVCLI